jgi:hypothetical protein
MERLKRVFGEHPWAVISADLLVAAFLVVLSFLAWRIGSTDSDRTANFLVVALGVAVGWAVGFLAAPVAKPDPERFAAFGKILSAFLTGYVVSKLGRFMEAAFFTDDGLSSRAWERLALIITSSIAMALVVYANRTYPFK